MYKDISNNTVTAVIAYSALSDTVREQKLLDISTGVVEGGWINNVSSIGLF